MKKILAFGVIGAGYFGRHYIRLLQEMPDATLCAVADRSGYAAEKNGVVVPVSVRRLTDARDLLADSQIDCVVIATPASTHASLAVAALAAGKHVLVEKPMAMNSEEGELMRDAVEESGRTFMIGHQYLYNDAIRHLKKKLDEGLLGVVKYIFAEHFSFGPIRSDIGCFAEMAVHELSLLDYLFSPREIRRVAGQRVDFLRSGREDFASVEISFAGGLTAAVVVSWFAPEKIRRMTIAGDKGMAVFDDRREEKLKFFLHPYVPLPTLSDVERMVPVGQGLRGAPLAEGSGSRFLEFSENEIITPVIPAAEPLRNQLEHFIACVQNGAEPVSGMAHGLRVMGMVDAILREIRDDGIAQ